MGNQVVGLAGGGVTGAAGAAGATTALPPNILNMTVPQVGHLPLMALRPFFMTSSTASTISFLALHLTQYPSGIENSRSGASCAGAVNASTLRFARPQRQLVKGRRKLTPIW